MSRLTAEQLNERPPWLRRLLRDVLAEGTRRTLWHWKVLMMDAAKLLRERGQRCLFFHVAHRSGMCSVFFQRRVRRRLNNH